MKVCSKCTRWRTRPDFYPDRRGRSQDGLLHACKPCERAAAAERARARYTPRNTMTQARDARGQFTRKSA